MAVKPKATTILARTSSALLSYVRSRVVPPQTSTLLYSISSNNDTSLFPEFIAHFNKNVAIGTLSHKLPSISHPYSCSLTTFESGDCTTFRSEIPGRAPISVGRWHLPTSSNPPRKQERTDDLEKILNSGGSFKDAWSDKTSKGDAQNAPLPLGLRNLSNVQSVVYLSENAHEGISASLDLHFPGVPKLGIIGSSTPFVTGRPFTLLQGTRAYSDGAVGIAICGYDHGPRYHLGYEGLQRISDPYTVTSATQNLVHTINGQNPARELISAISKHSSKQVDDISILGKEASFYLGVLDIEGKATKLYLITSGGPSRGTISMDGEEGPSVGSSIAFFHRPTEAGVHLPPPSSSRTSIEGLSTFIEDESDTIITPHGGFDEVFEISGRSIIPTENGLITSRGNENVWKCGVPGGWSALRW
ncbi:hypothetical protein FRC03_000240 [Tulasnella sp. 419]|nr:hypothetical protein FRC03_000240 [Tulasnella sp. 419]